MTEVAGLAGVAWLAAGLAAATVWAALAGIEAWRSVPAWGRAARLRRPAPAVAPSASARWLDTRIADAALPGSARTWVLVGLVGMAVVTALGLAAGGVALGLVAAGASVGGGGLVLATRRGSGDAALEAALPPILEATARGLRAGASLSTALASAARGGSPRVAQDLAVVLAEAPEVGLVAALEQWTGVRPLPGVRLAAAALALAVEVGGGGARALDGVALTLRQRQAAAGEVRALATQARLSAVVLTLAPLGFAALGAAGDARTAAILLRSPVGQGCLAVGLVLDAVGAAWMARVTRVGAS